MNELTNISPDVSQPDFYDTSPLGKLLWAGECLRAHVAGDVKNCSKAFGAVRVDHWNKALAEFREAEC